MGVRSDLCEELLLHFDDPLECTAQKQLQTIEKQELPIINEKIKLLLVHSMLFLIYFSVL